MKISNQKRDKIYEQILAYLYSVSPKALFTMNIAKEIARDEEFVKTLLIDLKKKGVIVEIKKSPEGVAYLKRSRWTLSDSAYQAYKKHQQEIPREVEDKH
jgi:predicted transcriptional regulator with HTH domain